MKPTWPSTFHVITLPLVILNCVQPSGQYCVIFDFDDPKPHQNFASLQSTVIQLKSNSSVNIISPGYNIGDHYPSNIICSWIVNCSQTSTNLHKLSTIKVHFDDFKLENSFNCALDSLWLFVGRTLSKSVHKAPDHKFCGSLIPEDVTFNTTLINLIFITDSHRNYRGFNVSFNVDHSKGSRESKCVDSWAQFSCSNGNCVNSSVVCNGIDDCHDGSDEDECHHDIVGEDDETRMMVCPSWMNSSKSTGRLSIIGGTTSLPDAWPWQVSLRIRSTSSIHWKHICGAVLIDYSTVLTAAHCFHSKSLNLTKYSLAFGEYKLDDESLVNQLITRYPRNIYIHPDYQLNGINGKEDDIAIIKLNHPVPNLINIKPVCIHNWTEFNDLPKFGFVTGWSQDYNNLVNVLSEARLPLISGPECTQFYGNEFFIDSDKIICAGQKEGHKDSCKGDSGGPLVVNIRGNWSLIAIVSSGSGCGLLDKPGIYTNVGYYIEWILETIVKVK